jgi:hypothetical protein
MSAKILSFKTIGGEELVAEVVREVTGGGILTDAAAPVTAYVLKRPHVLRFQPVGPGQLGLAFVPWTLSNPDISEITLPVKSLIAEPFEPAHRVEQQYLEQTSGIDLSSRV